MNTHFTIAQFEGASNEMIYAEFCNPDIEANNYVFKPVTFDLNKFDD
jgi:hypothetical protein